MINDTFDLITLILIIVGIMLTIYALYLSDWDLEKLLFKEEK